MAGDACGVVYEIPCRSCGLRCMGEADTGFGMELDGR